MRPTKGLPGLGYEVEDVVSMTFDTPSGAVGTACWNFCSGIWDDTIDIIGEFGSVSFSCFNNKPVRVEVAMKVADEDPSAETNGVGTNGDSGGLSHVKRLKDPEVTVHQAEQPDHVHQPLVEAMLEDLALWRTLPDGAPEKAAIVAGSRPGGCHSTGRAGARTAFVMDRALEGYYGGNGSRDKAFWETPELWTK